MACLSSLSVFDPFYGMVTFVNLAASLFCKVRFKFWLVLLRDPSSSLIYFLSDLSIVTCGLVPFLISCTGSFRLASDRISKVSFVFFLILLETSSRCSCD